VILCDTGPLVAAFNKADSDHARCVEFLASNWSRLVIPSLNDEGSDTHVPFPCFFAAPKLTGESLLGPTAKRERLP